MSSFDDGVTPLLDALKMKLPEALERGLLEAAQHSEYHIRRQLQETHKGGPRRSGALARSFQVSVVMDQGYPTGQAVSDLIYARIQDEGGRIKPKAGRKFLAIPIHRGSSTAWAKDTPGLSLMKRKNKPSLLVRKTGKDKFEPMFVLKKSVEIPARRYIARATTFATPGIEEILGDKADVAIKRASE